VNLDCFAFDQDWLERLNSQTVKRRRAVQENRVLSNHLFEDVPDDRLLTFDHLARLLDGRGVLLLLKLVVDERLEEFQSHLLRQTALMKFEFWPDDDHGTPGIVDALAQKVLAEAPLLAFERARKRFQ